MMKVERKRRSGGGPGFILPRSNKGVKTLSALTKRCGGYFCPETAGEGLVRKCTRFERDRVFTGTLNFDPTT